MKIHEYQAKEILQRYGVSVPVARVAMSPKEAYEIAKSLMQSSPVVVVKAQIHAGGRGKGGGVKVVKTAEAARDSAEAMLGTMLKTYQTGPEGQQVRKVLVEQGVAIERELYAAFVLDRETKRVTMMLSTEGGVEIEEVARKTPEKIAKAAIDPVLGLMPYQVRRACFQLGMKPELHGKAAKLMKSLYDAFIGTDASLLEVNPLIITKEGELLALDAKMNFDENALFRHQDLADLRDIHEEDPKEIAAKKHDLSYIALDGNIGCLVNGAGLAMATMDIIKHAGGEPANFLDVGGGATAEKVTAAFTIILEDPKVEAVLVNIFGGIMKCDVIAQGVIAAAQKTGLKVPVVVRLEGTNVELGKRMLEESKLSLVPADDMADAAQKVVSAAKQARAKGR
ncbi:MAG: ADP-forming succinate--CoA ligase subunit beta [Deltaproteobacteria bacterium]|nr:ADP-forming succinate--CoA ligase subunit beta [Deltaproteobacteria bacterium]